MKPALFLRVASVLSLIHCVLHTMGGVFGSPQHGAEEIAVIEAMKSHRFDFLGSARSYWDFFFGYGLFITIVLFVVAVLFWRLAAFVTTSPALVRSVAGIFAFNFGDEAISVFKLNLFIGQAAVYDSEKLLVT